MGTLFSRTTCQTDIPEEADSSDAFEAARLAFKAAQLNYLDSQNLFDVMQQALFYNLTHLPMDESIRYYLHAADNQKTLTDLLIMEVMLKKFPEDDDSIIVGDYHRLALASTFNFILLADSGWFVFDKFELASQRGVFSAVMQQMEEAFSVYVKTHDHYVLLLQRNMEIYGSHHLNDFCMVIIKQSLAFFKRIDSLSLLVNLNYAFKTLVKFCGILIDLHVSQNNNQIVQEVLGYYRAILLRFEPHKADFTAIFIEAEKKYKAFEMAIPHDDAKGISVTSRVKKKSKKKTKKSAKKKVPYKEVVAIDLSLSDSDCSKEEQAREVLTAVVNDKIDFMPVKDATLSYKDDSVAIIPLRDSLSPLVFVDEERTFSSMKYASCLEEEVIAPSMGDMDTSQTTTSEMDFLVLITQENPFSKLDTECNHGSISQQQDLLPLANEKNTTEYAKEASAIDGEIDFLKEALLSHSCKSEQIIVASFCPFREFPDPKFNIVQKKMYGILQEYPHCELKFFGSMFYKKDKTKAGPNDMDCLLTYQNYPEQALELINLFCQQGGVISADYLGKTTLFPSRIIKMQWDGVDIDFVVTSISHEAHCRHLDFTIGAVYYDLRHCIMLYPLEHSAQDIMDKRLRFISDSPRERLIQDPFIVLRAVRLMATADFFLESSAKAALQTINPAIFHDKNPDRLYRELTLLTEKGTACANIRVLDSLYLMAKLFYMPNLTGLNDCRNFLIFNAAKKMDEAVGRPLSPLLVYYAIYWCTFIRNSPLKSAKPYVRFPNEDFQKSDYYYRNFFYDLEQLYLKANPQCYSNNFFKVPIYYPFIFEMVPCRTSQQACTSTSSSLSARLLPDAADKIYWNYTTLKFS